MTDKIQYATFGLNRITLLLLILVTTLTSTVSAQQGVTGGSNSFFSFCPTDFTVNSDPRTWRANRRNLQVIPINIRFSERTASCVTHILFYTDNSVNLLLRSGSDYIATNLVDRNRSHFSQFSVGGRIAWVVPVYAVRNMTVWAQLNTTSAQRAGNYSGVISVAATFYGYHVSPEVMGTVNLTVPSVLDVSVTPTGGANISGGRGYYYVELGELYEGATSSWDINIQSNVHYNVSVRSENRGLKHQYSEASIGYDVTMDGSSFSASSGYSKAYSNYTPLSTSSIPFKIEVGNVDFMPAGNYSDNLIVTVSAW